MAKRIITIDGPAASGKSTVARQLADRLHWPCLDTGAMYRVVALACQQAGIDLNDESAVLETIATQRFDFIPGPDHLKVILNGQDVSETIRTPEVTDQVRFIAQAPKVRAELVRLQRLFADQYEALVTEGRDQGTVAFPKAILKIFLSADPLERARRRHAELRNQGLDEPLSSVAQAVETRDQSDQRRSVSPLIPAADAVSVDTTGLTPDEVVHVILTHLKDKGLKLPGS